MKKIIWLASYPKSGNTYARCFLSHYIHNLSSEFSFNLLNKIPKFETKKNFSHYIKNKRTNEKFIYYKHCTAVQEKLIKNFDQKNLIYKTHHFYGQLNNYEFTNKNNTLLFLYLVRDPREVLISYARHSNMQIEDMMEFFTSNKIIRNYEMETIVNWSMHYKSWKSFKGVPNLFIKFEDLVKNPSKEFKKIIEFLSKFINIKFNKIKFDETLKLTMFNNLQNLEKKVGFEESQENNFFNSGKIDSWKKILNEDQIKKIENNFYNEMKELKYI